MKVGKSKAKKNIKIIFEIFISGVIIFSVFYSRNVYGHLFLNEVKNVENTESKESNQNKQQDNPLQVNETQTKENKLSIEQLNSEIKKIISQYENKNKKNKIGLVYNDLNSGYRFAHNENEYFSMASTTKVVYAMHVYNRIALGQISENEQISYKSSYLQAGNGEITNNPKKESYDLDYVIMNMLTYSDNTATNMILRSDANALQLLKKFFSNFNINMPDLMLKNNKLTPASMETAWIYLYKNQDKYPKVIEYLKKSKSSEWIKEGVKNKEIASKYGQIKGVANDTAIVYDKTKGDYIILIYTANITNADKVIAEIANKINKLHDNNA
ncbi:MULTISPECIES: serine hydrolase [unclassified Gemella]|uniref:serine hydrolase n=1 Tax=unclassified Gemella TaxID=2624949 RepID=UPI001C04ACF8|nr:MULTISPECIES: serine hydrolase [unclassified Gemella]MBU0278643.1 class A beta-lactamase-related serine hydrolase [Gemella sp. zg-1178]QWQ39199.1 class A beta-lactamase-related serine hydrolase [Gemella sp. zg-570]